MSDLPPLDQQQAYVVVGSNEQVGPYALELLISEVVAGRLADTTPVWWPPLADWTTMSMHPGVAAEIARRRAAAGSTPAWAAPASASPYGSAPAAQPFAEPVHTEPTQAEPEGPAHFEPVASPTDGPVVEPNGGAPAAASVFDNPTGFEAPRGTFDSGTFNSGIVDAEIVDAEVVDAEVVEAADSAAVSGSGTSEAAAWEAAETQAAETLNSQPQDAAGTETTGFVGDSVGDIGASDQEAESTDSESAPGQAAEVTTTAAETSPEGGATGPVDDSTRATFNALVERSSTRADSLARVEAVDELFVNEVIASATSLGFGIDDRTDVDRRHELRFGEQSGNLLVISLGQIHSQDPDKIRSTAVPVTISYRADSGALIQATMATTKPNHGEIVVTPDEWTGQTTSSVSLFLSAEDYLNEDLSLAGDALSRDVAAVIKVVRARLA